MNISDNVLKKTFIWPSKQKSKYVASKVLTLEQCQRENFGNYVLEFQRKKNSACEEFIGNDVHFMLKRFKYQVFPDKNTLFSWTNWPCSIFCTVAVLPNLPTFLADFEKHKGIGSLFLGIWQFPQIQLYLAIQSKHKVDNSDKFKFWNRSMPISQVFSI